jgi:hypothetical protein
MILAFTRTSLGAMIVVGETKTRFLGSLIGYEKTPEQIGR